LRARVHSVRGPTSGARQGAAQTPVGGGPRFASARSTAPRPSYSFAVPRDPLPPLPGPKVGAGRDRSLVLGPPGDPFEREAERFAGQPSARLSQIPQFPPQQKVGAAPAGEEVPAEVAGAVRHAQTGGKPLAADIRRSAEAALGSDFARVRVHADRGADALARAFSARAFTVGRDVFFRQGELQPASREGRKLLTHELAHVAQQGVRGEGTVVQRTSLRVPAGESGIERFATVDKDISEMTAFQLRWVVRNHGARLADDPDLADEVRAQWDELGLPGQPAIPPPQQNQPLAAASAPEGEDSAKRKRAQRSPSPTEPTGGQDEEDPQQLVQPSQSAASAQERPLKRLESTSSRSALARPAQTAFRGFSSTSFAGTPGLPVGLPVGLPAGPPPGSLSGLPLSSPFLSSSQFRSPFEPPSAEPAPFDLSALVGKPDQEEAPLPTPRDEQQDVEPVLRVPPPQEAPPQVAPAQQTIGGLGRALEQFVASAKAAALAAPAAVASKRKQAAINRGVNQNSPVTKLTPKLRGQGAASQELVAAVGAIQAALQTYFEAVNTEQMSLNTPLDTAQFRAVAAAVRAAEVALARGAGQRLRPAANRMEIQEETQIGGHDLASHDKAWVTGYSPLDAARNQPLTLDIARTLNDRSTWDPGVGDRAFISAHVVDGGFGGPGTADNLVPAPDYYNTTPVVGETIKWAEGRALAALGQTPISYEGEVEYGRNAGTESRFEFNKMIRVPEDLLQFIPKSIRLTAKKLVPRGEGDGSSWDHWQEGEAIAGLNGQRLKILTVRPQQAAASGSEQGNT